MYQLFCNSWLGNLHIYIMRSKFHFKISSVAQMRRVFDLGNFLGENEKKFILSDKFSCWDDGEYIGTVSPEVIAKLPKVT